MGYARLVGFGDLHEVIIDFLLGLIGFENEFIGMAKHAFYQRCLSIPEHTSQTYNLSDILLNCFLICFSVEPYVHDTLAEVSSQSNPQSEV